MMSDGHPKLWMGVALGSVLLAGLSAGLVADRLLPDRRDTDSKGEIRAREHPGRPAAQSSMFHFDCRGFEEDPRETAARPASGATSDAARSEESNEHRSKVTRRMARRLELDAEQVAALEPIVGEAMVRARLYWQGARDEFCGMQAEFHRQVGEILRADQAVRFDEMRRDLWRRDRHRDDSNRDDPDHGHSADDGVSGECR